MSRLIEQSRQFKQNKMSLTLLVGVLAAISAPQSVLGSDGDDRVAVFDDSNSMPEDAEDQREGQDRSFAVSLKYRVGREESDGGGTDDTDPVGQGTPPVRISCVI